VVYSCCCGVHDEQLVTIDRATNPTKDNRIRLLTSVLRCESTGR
jgi:hypothetical protein